MSEQRTQDRESGSLEAEPLSSPVVGYQVSSSDTSYEGTVDQAVEGARSRRSQPRRLKLDTLFWAIGLLWTGGVLMAASLGYLDWFKSEAFNLFWDLPFGDRAWTLVFLGLAVVVGSEILVRSAVPAYRRNILGYVVLMIIFLSLGLGYVEIMWPLILIVVGLALLLRGARRGRR